MKHPLLETMTEEQRVVAQNLYGPNGEAVAAWIDSLTDPFFVAQLSCANMTEWMLDSTREQTLYYVEANHRIPHMNRAVEDATSAFLLAQEKWYADDCLVPYDSKYLNWIVYMTEAIVVADAWEV